MTRYFNSDEYLSSPLIYDGITKKTSNSDNKAAPFVHYFNTSGILQHNDIGPQHHPTDVGAIKVASHLLQFVRMTFGWDFSATGPEYVVPPLSKSLFIYLEIRARRYRGFSCIFYLLSSI